MSGKLEPLEHAAMLDQIGRHRLDENEIEPARPLPIRHDDIVQDLGEHLARERVEKIVHRLAAGRTDLARVVEHAFHIAAFHAAARELRDVHDRVVMQLLGELDAADSLEGMLRGEQQHAPLARAVIDEGEPRQIVIDGADHPFEQGAGRRPVVVTILAIVAANGQSGERHRLLCRFEEQRLDRRIEHAFVQPEEIIFVVLLQPLGTGALFEPAAGALDLWQHAFTPDLRGAREPGLAGLDRRGCCALGLGCSLVGQLGDPLGHARGNITRALARRWSGLRLRLIGAVGHDRH